MKYACKNTKLNKNIFDNKFVFVYILYSAKTKVETEACACNAEKNIILYLL